MDKTKLITSVKKKLIAIKNATLNLAKNLKQYMRYYYTFFLVIVLVIIGDVLIFYTSEIKIISLSYLTPIFSTLIGLNISLFALSITVYALILKLTDGKNFNAMDTYAAALAANGNFQKAAQIAKKAVELAVSAGQKNTADEIEKHLNLYNSQHTYRE